MEAGAKSWRKYHKWSSILTAMANKYAHCAENSDFGNKTWRIPNSQNPYIQCEKVKFSGEVAQNEDNC